MSVSSSDSLNAIFTPANDEENDGTFRLGRVASVMTNSDPFSDRQQPKELQEKLRQKELMAQLNTLKTKVAKLEEKQQQKEMEKVQQKTQFVSAADQFNAILGRISEFEKQQRKQYENMAEVIAEKLAKLQSDQKALLGKINALEKQQQKGEHQQAKALSNVRLNCWDGAACHKGIEIIGSKRLTVLCRETVWDFLSVFSKHQNLLANGSSDIFYFEISVKNMKREVDFGFAVKKLGQLDGSIRSRRGTYEYDGDDEFWINGFRKGQNGKFAFGVGDVVGIGVNSANRQLIFTKNGLRLDTSEFFVAPSFIYQLFPFVSLRDFDDQIEANFGPDFKFRFNIL